MEIAFKTEELRNICAKTSIARKVFTMEEVTLIQSTLADLRAADFFADLPGELWSFCNAKLLYVFRISDDLSLLVDHNHRDPPLNVDKTLDLRKVYRVMINEIQRLS